AGQDVAHLAAHSPRLGFSENPFQSGRDDQAWYGFQFFLFLNYDLWAGQIILNHWQAGLLHFVDDNLRRHHQHDRLRFPGAGGRRAEGVENLDHQRLPLLFRPFQRIPSAQQHGAAVRDTERFMEGDSGQLRLLNELRERDRLTNGATFKNRCDEGRDREQIYLGDAGLVGIKVESQIAAVGRHRRPNEQLKARGDGVDLWHKYGLRPKYVLGLK